MAVRRITGLLMACALMLLFAACQMVVTPPVPTLPATEEASGAGVPTTPLPEPQEVGDPERGRDLFETGGVVVSAENRCARCHTLDGTEMEVEIAGPSLQGIAERAGTRASETSAVDYLRQSIVDPSAYVVEGYKDNRMPKAYGFWLGEEDVDHLVAFMLTQ